MRNTDLIQYYYLYPLIILNSFYVRLYGIILNKKHNTGYIIESSILIGFKPLITATIFYILCFVLCFYQTGNGVIIYIFNLCCCVLSVLTLCLSLFIMVGFVKTSIKNQ